MCIIGRAEVVAVLWLRMRLMRRVTWELGRPGVCVKVAVIMYALHQIIGLVPALAGVLAMVLVAPLNMMLGALVHKYRLDVISKTDARVKIMTEVINGTPPRIHACMPECNHAVLLEYHPGGHVIHSVAVRCSGRGTSSFADHLLAAEWGGA